MSTAVKLVSAAVAGLVAFSLPGGPAVAAPATTTITMRVMDCEGCSIRPNNVFDMSKETWSGASVVVRGGRVMLVVPTSMTKGMFFEVSAPWEKGDLQAYPVINMSGDRSQGNGCWRGTDRSRVTIGVDVNKYRFPSLGGGRGVAPNAVTLGNLSYGPSDPIRDYGGALPPVAHQDAIFCP
jgi:hypothetical protein